MIFAVVAYLQIYDFVSAYGMSNLVESLELKIKQRKNISDNELVVDPLTFVNDYGLRRKGVVKQILRTTPRPRFIPPSESELKLKIIDLMKQSLYDAQGHIMTLDPILEKYKDDPALRMAFIFDRLEQIIIDSRRVYTVCRKWFLRKRVQEQTIWYAHIAKKFFDVLYIVEHVIDTHFKYMELLG